MLQRMREYVQGWIATVIMSLLALTFALWGIQSYLSINAGPTKVAKVDGTDITETQLNSAYERLRQTLQSQSSSLLPLDVATQQKLKQQALQQLITTQVLSTAASKEGYNVAPEQLNEAIMQIPAFKENGQFSPARFQQVLNELGYSQEQFFVDLSQSLVASQAQLGIQKSAFGLPNEASQALALMAQKRDIRYTIVPLTKFQNAINITPDMIDAYYQQHQDQYKTPEKMSIQYIELSVDNLEKNIQVKDQELQQYYQDNISAFTKNGTALPFAAVKDEVTKAVKQQKLQQAFSDQSQQLSDLTYTNSNSLAPAADALNLKIETTDYFTRQGGKAGITANPQIVAAAFNEDVIKNGNNSNAIQIKDGDLIVLRSKDYQPAAVQPLAAVKDKIVADLQLQAEQQAAQAWATKIISAINTNTDLAKISQQYQLNWQNKLAVDRQTTSINPQILQTAFTLPRPSEKPSIGGILLANGGYALVGVDKIIDDSSKKSDQQIKVMQNQIENSYGQLDYLLYVDDLMKKANIKIYPQQQAQNN